MLKKLPFCFRYFQANRQSRTSCRRSINLDFPDVDFFHPFNATVSPFRDWFRRTGMRSSGWQVGFHHSPAIVEITLSTVKLSLSEADWFRALWSVTLLQSFNVFYASKTCLYFVKNKPSCLLAFWGFVFLLLVFHMLLGPNIRFILKMDSDSDVRDVLSAPINYEHRDSSVHCVCLCGSVTIFIIQILLVMSNIPLASLDYLLCLF
jgi:hypothetical protein